MKPLQPRKENTNIVVDITVEGMLISIPLANCASTAINRGTLLTSAQKRRSTRFTYERLVLKQTSMTLMMRRTNSPPSHSQRYQ
jgi:hypothetical protein